jgi:hypothetical protein
VAEEGVGTEGAGPQPNGEKIDSAQPDSATAAKRAARPATVCDLSIPRSTDIFVARFFGKSLRDYRLRRAAVQSRVFFCALAAIRAAHYTQARFTLPPAAPNSAGFLDVFAVPPAPPTPVVFSKAVFRANRIGETPDGG